MTVRELIERLRACNPDAKVLIGISMEDAAYVNEDEDEDGPFVEIVT